MRSTFRQGILQSPSTPVARVGTTISLLAGDAPTTIVVAHGPTDYLILEPRTVSTAWLGVSAGVDCWLYINIDVRTGVRTFGKTNLRPVTATTAPLSPANDQHWFNLTTTTMNVWSSSHNRWIERIRVFVCEMDGGVTPLSMSISSPAFTGTQVGLTGERFTGTILIDASSGRAITTAGGHFVTTETPLAAQFESTSNIRIEPLLLRANSTQTLSPYTVVEWSDFGEISAADPLTPVGNRLLGMVESSVLAGASTTVTTTGVITNSAWNWSLINTPLYVGAGGTLSLVPTGTATPVAVVIDVDRIQLLPATRSVGGGSSQPFAAATTTTMGGVTLSTPSTVVGQAEVVTTTDPRIVNAASRLGDTFVGNVTISVPPTNPQHVATKAYVDAATVSAPTLVRTNADVVPMVVGMLAQSSGAGQMARMVATTTAGVDYIGVVNATTAVGTPGEVQYSGTITLTTGQWNAVGSSPLGLVEGAKYFASTSSPGFLTITPPISGILVEVGTALSSTTLDIHRGLVIKL